MHLANKSYTKIIYLLIFLAAAVFTALLPSPTHATIQSQQLPISINPHLIQVNSDKTLSFQYCPRLSQPGSELAYTHTDELFNQLSNIYYDSSTHQYTTDRCHDSSGSGRNYTIGDDGSYYSVFVDKNMLGQPEIKLAKYKHNKRHWEVGFEGCGRANNAYPGSITEGFDGDIYAHMSACNSNDTSYLIGVKSKDGTLKFSQELSLTQSHQHHIHAYSEGITMLDDQSIRHFTYAGQEMVDRKYDIQAL